MKFFVSVWFVLWFTDFMHKHTLNKEKNEIIYTEKLFSALENAVQNLVNC